MHAWTRRAPRARGRAGWIWTRFAAALVALSGCGDADPLARAGVSLRAPDGWTRAAVDRWAVPGTPLAAWSGPDRSSFVVYRTLPTPGTEAASLLTGLTNRFENLPGLTVRARGVEKVAGLDAARVELVAPGTGDAIAPTGQGVPLVDGQPSLTPTFRVLLTIPRPADTLCLVWNAPEEAADAVRSRVRETLKSIAIDRGRLATSSY